MHQDFNHFPGDLGRSGGFVSLACLAGALLLGGCGQTAATTAKGTAAPAASPTVEASPGGVPIVDLAAVNTTTPTYEADIKPLVRQVCADCHFTFMVKEAFEANREAMIKAVRGEGLKSMPPKPENWRVATDRIPAYREALEAALSNYAGK